MTATVHKIRPEAALPPHLDPQVYGDSLRVVVYPSKFASAKEASRELSFDTAQELFKTLYGEPQWLPADSVVPENAADLKEASSAVIAALPGADRKRENVGLSRVVFLDFDKSVDGQSGLTDSEVSKLIECLNTLDRVFWLHTTTSTPYLPVGRTKLRAILPIDAPVMPDVWQQLRNGVAGSVERSTGIKADSTKTHPADLMFLPVFHPAHHEKWQTWTSAPEVQDLLFALPGLENVSSGSAYDRLRLAREKDRALYGVAKSAAEAYVRESLGSTDTQAVRAYAAETLWPECERGLKDNKVSEAVLRWGPAERKIKRVFADTVAEAVRVSNAKLSEHRSKLLAELRMSGTETAILSAVNSASGRSVKRAVAHIERLGSLLSVAKELGVNEDEIGVIDRRVEMKIADHTLDKVKPDLNQAWQAARHGSKFDVSSDFDAAEKKRRNTQDYNFDLDDNGNPKPSAGNLVRVLAYDPKLQNLFARDVRELNMAFVPLRDFEKMTALEPVNLLSGKNGYDPFTRYLKREHGMGGVELDTYKTAMKSGFKDFAEYDPLVDWLSSLAGQECSLEELETFFVRYGGVKDDAEGLTRAITVAFFTSAVRTVFEPACTCDYIWTLVGVQGAGKTKLLSEGLCPDKKFFGRIKPKELQGEGKDSGRGALKTQGRSWLIEIPELKFNPELMEEVKDFVSETEPVDRLAYAEFDTVFRRRGVMVATTNRQNLFKDTTGARRFPVLEFTKKISKQDLVKMHKESPRLWARALKLWQTNPELVDVPERLWAAAEARSETHRDVDVLEDTIRSLTQGVLAWPLGESFAAGGYDKLENELPGVRTSNGSPKALTITQWNQILKIRGRQSIAAYLEAVGWVKMETRKVVRGKQILVWVHPDHVAEFSAAK